MPKFINLKNIIIVGLVLYAIKNYWETYLQLGFQQSADAAAGFAMGLIFAFFLYIEVKCVKYLYKEAYQWWNGRRARRTPYAE